MPTSRNPNQNRAALWRIFSSNKSTPANWKTGFYANHDPNNQEVGFIFAWGGSELWSLFKYSRVKLKNQKPIAVDVLFKAYPMVPFSCRSNLARRYLKAENISRERTSECQKKVIFSKVKSMKIGKRNNEWRGCVQFVGICEKENLSKKAKLQ